jgi:hypothetical protein
MSCIHQALPAESPVSPCVSGPRPTQTSAFCNLCAPARCFGHDQNRNINPEWAALSAHQSAGAVEQPVELQCVTLYVSDGLNLLIRRQFSGHTVRSGRGGAAAHAGAFACCVLGLIRKVFPLRKPQPLRYPTVWRGAAIAALQTIPQNVLPDFGDLFDIAVGHIRARDVSQKRFPIFDFQCNRLDHSGVLESCATSGWMDALEKAVALPLPQSRNRRK